MGAFLRRGMLDVVMSAKELDAAVELNRRLEAEIGQLRERVDRLMEYEDRLAALIRAVRELDAETLIARARTSLRSGDLARAGAE